MTLHILNKGPSEIIICEKMSLCLSENESILLIEDGSYHCLSNSSDRYGWLKHNTKLYVLENDALARGVSIPDHITAISYEDFVKLTISHSSTISWY